MPAASRIGENKAAGVLCACTEQMLSSNCFAREVLGHLHTRQEAPGGCQRHEGAKALRLPDTPPVCAQTRRRGAMMLCASPRALRALATWQTAMVATPLCL